MPADQPAHLAGCLDINASVKGARFDGLGDGEVGGVRFIAQAVDWVPEVLFDIMQAAFRHRGFSFVRVIQRCPEFMPKAFDPWLHDPQRTMLLTHPKFKQFTTASGRAPTQARFNNDSATVSAVP